jgi:hypothetical protein
VSVEVVIAGQNRWDAVRANATDRSVIFVDYDIDAPPGEVRRLVAERDVLLVVLIDRQPAQGVAPRAFYPWFYSALDLRQPECVPPDPRYCSQQVLDAVVSRELLGGRPGSLYAYNDWCVAHECKTLYYQFETRAIAGSWYSWRDPATGVYHSRFASYVWTRFERGAVAELPYDGAWYSADVLARLIYAVALGSLGWGVPRRIVWGARSESESPGWHACYPATRCLDGAVRALTGLGPAPVTVRPPAPPVAGIPYAPEVPVFGTCYAACGEVLCYKYMYDIVDSATVAALMRAVACAADKAMRWRESLAA